MFYKRLTSRKFGLTLGIVICGVIAAFVLPAIPVFEWLQPYSLNVFITTAGVVTTYIVGNVTMDLINKKYTETYNNDR